MKMRWRRMSVETRLQGGRMNLGWRSVVMRSCRATWWVDDTLTRHHLTR